jgi:predicted lipid-binding transport protein (Tim44 family)
MDNIDVPATLELLAAIAIVLGIAATFFKKTKEVPGETAEQAPYKVEAPATVVAVEDAGQVEIPAKKPAAPKADKPATAKKPVAKKAPAKKTAKKKTTSA